jgi:hypothetical protein
MKNTNGKSRLFTVAQLMNENPKNVAWVRIRVLRGISADIERGFRYRNFQSAKYFHPPSKSHMIY